MPVITIDASEAHVAPLRGWGRYVSELVKALGDGAAGDLCIDAALRSGHGPELLWEQIGLAHHARRAGSSVLHAPNCFLPLRRPCPGVVTIHDLAFEAHPGDFSRRTGLKYRTLVPRAVHSAQRVICVSSFTASDVVRRYGVDADKLRVIGLAPSLARLGRAVSEPPGGPFLLAVGDLRAKKDLLTLIAAWRQLRRQGAEYRLVVAGVDAGEGPRLRQAAAGEPLELPGYVDDASLDELLCGADVLIHPSRYEGFGLVLLEAMARGTPVIAARATALPETAGPGALYFDPGDSSDLAARLQELWGDDALRARLVAHGRVRAAEASWARTAALTADVYRELL